jgi:hypothetical protein
MQYELKLFLMASLVVVNGCHCCADSGIVCDPHIVVGTAYFVGWFVEYKRMFHIISR